MAMTLARKALLSIGIAAPLIGGSAVLAPSLLWGDRADYSRVASIEATREFQDAALLERAWSLPVARLYRPGVDYQRNGSFCGPTSVVNVMRSLGLAGDQRTVLADSGVFTIVGMVPGGLTLDELARVAQRKLGRSVTVLRDLDREVFREHLRRTNDPAARYVVNFARAPLFGRGGGHHSPIAGYLAEEDLVLVLDVNAKYKPWLVRSDRLYEAMNTVDRSAGKKRGLLLVESR